MIPVAKRKPRGKIRAGKHTPPGGFDGLLSKKVGRHLGNPKSRAGSFGRVLRKGNRKASLRRG